MEKRISIRVRDDLSLAGVLHLPDQGAKAGVLICHGLLSDKDSQKHSLLARMLCEVGIAALRFDFEGRGQSPGDMLDLSFSRQVIQASAALDTLKDTAGVSQMGISGSSMGGAVAILLAAQDTSISCLVTMAAVARTDLLGQRVVGPKGMAVWERKGSLRLDDEPVGWSLVADGRKLDLPGAAARIRCKWLIMHGQDDEVVPLSDADLLYESAAYAPTMEVIDHADHSFSSEEHRQMVVQMAVDFFAKTFRAV